MPTYFICYLSTSLFRDLWGFELNCKFLISGWRSNRRQPRGPDGGSKIHRDPDQRAQVSGLSSTICIFSNPGTSRAFLVRFRPLLIRFSPFLLTFSLFLVWLRPFLVRFSPFLDRLRAFLLRFRPFLLIFRLFLLWFRPFLVRFRAFLVRLRPVLFRFWAIFVRLWAFWILKTTVVTSF